MEIELFPDPGADDPAARAAVSALTLEGLTGDERPPGSVGAWRRAGLDEAVDRSVASSHPRASGAAPNGRRTNGAAPDDTAPNGSARGDYVPPARSSRGAARA